MDIKKEVENLTEELIAIRRDLHRHPELGYEEYRTAAIIGDYLKQCGLEVKTVAKTGVVGLLRGNRPGKTVLLRADMDALAQTEQTGLPYQSIYEGKMHACGHDGHVAMLLIAAKILAAYGEEVQGNIKFVFQPNEETAGALDMIQEGILDDPQVDAALGIHLWTPLESGTIGLVSGPIMAANEEFELTITGKAGHTSSPQTAIDPIIAAAGIVQNIQLIQTRETSVFTPTLIMFGKIQGGTGRNIVAAKVELGGTIRFLAEHEEGYKTLLKEKFERVVKGICEAARTEYRLKYIPSNPAVLNDQYMAQLVRVAARETFGTEEVIKPYLCLAGDDFAEFTQRVPSAYYFLGTGNQAKGTGYPHHHPCFNIDEDTLPLGVEMHVRSALAFLNG